MAHQPLSRPDPFQDTEGDEPLFSLEHSPKNSDVTNLASKLAEHVGSENSTDLALDLVLNEIVEQARLATTATGAAIALLRDDEMVCRATSGASAPGLGVRLSTRTGLSGACLRTRQVQRCEDTQTDPRVNATALLSLDVRSILVVPILTRQEIAGVFEILSPRPKAFGDREVLTLEALSRRIVRNLEKAAAPPEPPATMPDVTPLELLPVETEAKVPLNAVLSEIQRNIAGRDYWSTVLTAVVIGLALLLGWMIGYAGWRKAASLRTQPAPNQASSKVIPDSTVELPPQLAKESPKRPGQTKVAVTPPAPGGLVVYQNGKIVFEIPPGETTASKVRLAGGPGPVRLGPEVAARYLLRRVEAAYPADTQGSQELGPVTLEIQVGTDGSVSQAALIRGDPSLASSAIAAARQWQYRPYAPDGTPMDFSTQITVNFSAK